MKKIVLLLITLISTFQWSYSQDYYYKDFAPFDQKIPAPEAFLEYGIGSYHTRHDLIVAYLTKLAEVSDRASIETYGKTHEGRKLVIFTVTSAENQRNLEDLQKKHLELVQLKASSKDSDVPVFVQLGYNV
ncbi:MAG: zinc carboxypeptidase, partial [Flavobacteriaceae bacterium]|nr:zinc carboxypeptidase [Flavobacteriaceae bacterium]